MKQIKSWRQTVAKSERLSERARDTDREKGERSRSDETNKSEDTEGRRRRREGGEREREREREREEGVMKQIKARGQKVTVLPGTLPRLQVDSRVVSGKGHRPCCGRDR